MAHVRPLLEYNTTVWSPFQIGEITRIERVQRSFTRRLPGFGDLSYAERLDRLGLETLEERRLKFDLVQAFKIIKGLSALRFDDFFQYKTDDRTRAHGFQLRLRTAPRLDICKHFFANRVVNVLNDLPARAVNARSIVEFKYHVSGQFLRSHCVQQL